MRNAYISVLCLSLSYLLYCIEGVALLTPSYVVFPTTLFTSVDHWSISTNPNRDLNLSNLIYSVLVHNLLVSQILWKSAQNV